MARRKTLSPETIQTALESLNERIDLTVKGGEADAGELAPLFAARQELLSIGGVETENGGNGAVKRTRKARTPRTTTAENEATV